MRSSTQQHLEKHRSSPVLIGRRPELDLLRRLVASPPALVMIAGDAGTGKSRLVGELIGQPAPIARRVLLGRCHPQRDPFPLGPVIEALRGVAADAPLGPLTAVAGALSQLLPELSSVLPPRLDPLVDEHAERHRVFRALRALLGALGQCVCALEDLHLADERTLEFLSFLVSDPPPRLALVLTYRDEELASSALRTLRSRAPENAGTAQIELAPLDAEGVRALVSAILDADPPEGFASAVRDWTAGFPFAVEELLELLRACGDLDPDGDRWPRRPLGRLSLPRAVRDRVLERARPLSHDGILVLRAAAVIRRPADEELIAKVAGIPARRSGDGLCEVLSTALLQGDTATRYEFRHSLAARAVYEQIAGPERRRLHLRAAHALEGSAPSALLAQVAYHFKQAGCRTKWLRYAEHAADAASARGEDRAAAAILEDALSVPHLARAPATRMALKLGSAALFGRVPGAAIGVLKSVLCDDSLPTGLRGELRLSLARLLLLVGEGVAAEREMVRAAKELRRRPHGRWRSLPRRDRPAAAMARRPSGSAKRSRRPHAKPSRRA